MMPRLVVPAAIAVLVIGVLANLARQHYGEASGHALLIVLVTAWHRIRPTIDQILELRVGRLEWECRAAAAQARIQEAHARMTEIAHEAMEVQRQAGTVRVVADTQTH